MKLNRGDRVDCRIKDAAIVSSYKEYDEVRTFEIVSVDKHGYYLFVPSYVYIKKSVTADVYQCKHLGIDNRFIDEQIVYIQENQVYRVSAVLDGMSCIVCQEFFFMAEPNQENGSLVCYSCRKNPYR